MGGSLELGILGWWGGRGGSKSRWEGLPTPEEAAWPHHTNAHLGPISTS